MIAAAAENRALGKDNQLIWHLPNDFKRFKNLTTGHYIIMGRKTFESFPKPLPNRIHIIITRQKDYKAEGCIIVDSIEKAIEICPKEDENFIIGGGEIYKQSLPYADKIELTVVHHNFEADTFFPKILIEDWEMVNADFQSKDDKHLYDYTFETYIKKQKTPQQ